MQKFGADLKILKNIRLWITKTIGYASKSSVSALILNDFEKTLDFFIVSAYHANNNKILIKFEVNILLFE